jgi:hypothetical protein
MTVMEPVASAKTTTTVNARKAVTTRAKTAAAATTAKATPVPAATATSGANQHERATCCSPWQLRTAEIARLCKCGGGGNG